MFDLIVLVIKVIAMHATKYTVYCRVITITAILTAREIIFSIASIFVKIYDRATD